MSQRRIFTLVESCPASQHEDASTNRGEMGAATRYMAGWLDANPGRWFIVGEMPSKNEQLGVNHMSMRKFGYEAQLVNGKVYARSPHASGAPLSDLVSKHKPVGQGEKMPRLERDRFNWSLDELRTAASTAREWLRGGVGYCSGLASRHSASCA